ncbi:primosomal protein N' [Adlercreutzia sp. ZJ304]|uniref:replication restart helicase PriA n=1 Tax=Adlercreutzia sp. ZJ304 TaxID=2709791 RepID=UPI0013ED9FA2|nr:primosomal protein N' [Adlercreutzia sp. ZJ304]
MRVAEVILDIPAQALDAPYTYLVPKDADDIEIGCAVLVPLGGRKAIGFVMLVRDIDKPERPLKPIDQVVSKPYFNAKGADCARFLASRYVAPLSVCIRLFTPPSALPRIVRLRNGGWRLEEPTIGEVDDRWVVEGPNIATFHPRKNAVKQIAVLDAVRRGDVRMAELALEYGNISQVVKNLAEKDVVSIVRRRRMRNGGGADGEMFRGGYGRPAELTESQRNALQAITCAADKRSGDVVVVDGVTGSGKTEVYLQAIEHILTQGRNAIVLVPEISLTPQTVARFRGRFGGAVAVMHSRMSAGERYDQWDFIRSGEARVVVGARSALFTPLQDVGLIVIDEEHETTYKQENAPRYVARDVAEWMMRENGGTLVLGSATPSIEALYRARIDTHWSLVSMPDRANGAPLPKIEVVDMAAEFGAGNRSMFSARLASALKEQLSLGNKAVLLLNQRGFASFLLCRDCGFVPECINCATSLTYHEQGNKLVCHHCGYTVSVPAICPQCESPYLRRFGAGTQRVQSELRSLLDEQFGEEAAFPIIRMDADTTSTKGSHQRLLEEFASAPSAVLLGTQMIAKGLDFEDVTLVGVINADTQLHLPDYRAAERTFDLIEQVAGRAGRGKLPGNVIVQTYLADSLAIRTAAAYDRKAFLHEELQKRKMLRYPPFVRMANVLVWGREEAVVKAEAENLYSQLASLALCDNVGDMEVLPANPCVLSRVRGNYRWHILVKADPASDISNLLRPIFTSRKAIKEVNVALDIDPIDIL